MADAEYTALNTAVQQIRYQLQRLADAATTEPVTLEERRDLRVYTFAGVHHDLDTAIDIAEDKLFSFMEDGDVDPQRYTANTGQLADQRFVHTITVEYKVRK